MNKFVPLILYAVLLTACATTTPEPTTTVVKLLPSSTLFPSSTVTVTPTPTFIPQLAACVKGANTIRLRKGPSTKFEIIIGLPAGTCLSIYGFNKDKSWAWGNFKDQFGWASSQYLALQGDADKLPVIADNTTASSFPVNSTFSVNTITKTQTLKSPTPTKRPTRTSPPQKPATPKPATPVIIPTVSMLLCSNAPAYTNVTCKITRAYCSYQPTTSGKPTFCNDFPYPNNNFTLVRWGVDWSNLDGYCLIVSGYVDRYNGKSQIVVSNSSQVSFCP